MSADSSTRAATKPMNMVSRELRKQDLDLELIERAGKYGKDELNKADDALTKASEELKKSQEAARHQEKSETEEQLKEKALKENDETAKKACQSYENEQEETRSDILNTETADEFSAEPISETVLGTRLDLRG
ncbi:hypothetical protein C817_02401 [Dorea sp. 5-2]|nr:hypothetical protein C817_02401 [Dorea sp. 5-2]